MRETEGNVSSERLAFAMIAEFTAAIIDKCSGHQIQQSHLYKAGAIQPLVNLLHSGCIKAQEAALSAIGTLCQENKELAEAVIHSKPANSRQSTIATMLDFVRDKDPNMRLTAATCLTNLYRTGVFSEPFSEVILVVLPALVKLLQDTTGDIQERAPLVLGDLIKDSEEMQKAAYDADAIPRLAELLNSVCSKEADEEEPKQQLGVPGEGSVARRKEKIKENALTAIGAATLAKEECRTQAIEAKVLPHMISGLTSKHPKTRLAACQVARSLSRSVSHLRTSLVDAGIAPPLIKLLYDENIGVQTAACSALCNLVIEFSPMKKSVIEAGAINRFVEFARGSDLQLQLNAVWSLQNLLYKADLQAKKAVMDILTFDTLLDLTRRPNFNIQEQVLEIVRNLAFGGQEDTDWLLENMGEDTILDLVESKLQIVSYMDVDDGEEDLKLRTATMIAALYIIINLSSNSEGPKMAFMSRPTIVHCVISNLQHEDPRVRLGACWVLINWTFHNAEESDSSKLIQRCINLRELGAEEKLEELASDSDRDVRDRSNIALNQLQAVFASIAET
ncbi:armadillo-type protein [Mycotypha africana]|uniref:armadillo-type protein n=1 Tax=Mycotypha africana TaxID=64632 RepID=UPI002301A4BE|nr:armadillo-type protein [Mycotypha africana]KAI8984453.1 armadillo-type protein [Mycotypha africana]